MDAASESLIVRVLERPSPDWDSFVAVAPGASIYHRSAWVRLAKDVFGHTVACAEARNAAGAGQREFMLIRFPSRLCSDGGRAINAPDQRWPETLRGEPADVFQRWRAELQPQGFQVAAQIVDFPDGLPGDAALFLMWGGGES